MGGELASIPILLMSYKSDNEFASHVGFEPVNGRLDLTPPPRCASLGTCAIFHHYLAKMVERARADLAL